MTVILRLHRLLAADGRCFDVAIDHGFFNERSFLTGIEDMRRAVATIVATCAVGTCSVEAVDAVGGVRSWRETSTRIAAGWPALPLVVDEPGWRWDDLRALFVGPADRDNGE